MNDLRIGFIGAGEIAAYALPVLDADPTVKLVAVADVNIDAARKFAERKPGAQAHADYRELLARPDVDVVYIATPPFLHRQMLLDSIAANKHILCEKPFVMNLDEAREVAKVAKTKPKLKIGSCSSRFLTASGHLARDLIQSKKLGDITHIRFISTQPGRPRTMNPGGWKSDAGKSGGGLVMDWCCYDIDYLTFLLGPGYRPAAILGSTNAPREQMEAGYTATILSDTGPWIHLERISGEPGPARASLEIRGTEGGLDISMTPSAQGPILYRPKEFLVPPDTQPLEAPPVTWQGIHLVPLQDLISAIREDRQPFTPPERSLMIHQVLEGIYASAKTRQLVRV